MNEVPLTWQTSSYSGNASGNCVEVGEGAGFTALRDTKDRASGNHTYSNAAWAALRNHLQHR